MPDMQRSGVPHRQGRHSTQPDESARACSAVGVPIRATDTAGDGRNGDTCAADAGEAILLINPFAFVVVPGTSCGKTQLNAFRLGGDNLWQQNLPRVHFLTFGASKTADSIIGSTLGSCEHGSVKRASLGFSQVLRVADHT